MSIHSKTKWKLFKGECASWYAEIWGQPFIYLFLENSRNIYKNTCIPGKPFLPGFPLSPSSP